MGARASVPSMVMTQDDPFVFDQFLFGNSDDVKRPVGKTVKQITEEASGLSTSPIIGKNINELKFGADGKITYFHGGSTVTDVYEKDGKITLFNDQNPTTYEITHSDEYPRRVVSVSSLDDLEFETKPGRFAGFDAVLASPKGTKARQEAEEKARKEAEEKARKKPVTKRIGSTPPESGTTLKNVGTEPAQTRLRGQGLVETVYSGRQTHEEQVDKIGRIKQRRDKQTKKAEEKPKLEAEKKERKAARRARRESDAATETAEQASKNPGGIPVRRTG